MRAGIFKRQTKGRELDPVHLVVDARAIVFFADTLGIAHKNGEAAPLTFFAHIDAQADIERRRRGEETIWEVIGCDERYLLHGEESYEYFAAIRDGDGVTVKTRISDFRDSSKGHLEFAVIEQQLWCDARLLMTARSTLIHRLS